MKTRVPRHAAAIAALFLFALPAAAQKTTVSGTVIDPKGIPYSYSSVSAQIVPQNVSPTVGNPPVQFSGFNGPVATDIDGNWTMDLFSNTSISPGGTKWRFTICIANQSVIGVTNQVQAPLGFGNQCFTPPDITVTGATQNLDSLINPYAPVLFRIPFTNVLINHTFTAREAGIDFVAGDCVSITGADNPSGQDTQVTFSFTCGAASARHVCEIIIGADNLAAPLVDADIAPQGRQCFVPANATVLEVDVAADAGTPSVVVDKITPAGVRTNLLSSALATAASGGVACANTGGTTGLDGVTTCSATLQNTTLPVGYYIETRTATAGGTAKRMSISVVWTVS